jgi:hypothetical protein
MDPVRLHLYRRTARPPLQGVSCVRSVDGASSYTRAAGSHGVGSGSCSSPSHPSELDDGRGLRATGRKPVWARRHRFCALSWRVAITATIAPGARISASGHAHPDADPNTSGGHVCGRRERRPHARGNRSRSPRAAPHRPTRQARSSEQAHANHSSTRWPAGAVVFSCCFLELQRRLISMTSCPASARRCHPGLHSGGCSRGC